MEQNPVLALCISTERRLTWAETPKKNSCTDSKYLITGPLIVPCAEIGSLVRSSEIMLVSAVSIKQGYEAYLGGSQGVLLTLLASSSGYFMHACRVPVTQPHVGE